MGCFVFAFKVGFWTGVLTMIVKYLDKEVFEDFLIDILPEKDVYMGLYTMVSLVVVFHTVQSYTRFMNGMTLIYQIMGDFHDVSSLLICFSNASPASEEDKVEFQNTLVRLFSMHFMLCLAHLEDPHAKHESPRAMHVASLIDPQGIDEDTLQKLAETEDRPSSCYQRILDLMMHAFNTGVISVPAPLFTRCFQELGNGMIKFHEAMQYMEVPFPLPYMAITDMLLVLFSLMTPFFVSNWTKEVPVAGLFAFCPTFAMWLLHGVAEELDNPFDGDSTDLDSDKLMEDFNARLCALLGHRSMRPPQSSISAKESNKEIPSSFKMLKSDLKDAGAATLHHVFSPFLNACHIVKDVSRAAIGAPKQHENGEPQTKTTGDLDTAKTTGDLDTARTTGDLDTAAGVLEPPREKQAENASPPTMEEELPKFETSSV